KVWGFAGSAADYGGPSTNVSTLSGTLYYINATHPVQNKKPEIKSAVTNSIDSITLSWKSVAGWQQNPTGSNGYYVYYDKVKRANYADNANMEFIQDTVLGIGGLDEKTKYYFTVIAAVEGDEVAGAAGTKLYSLPSTIDSATTYGAPEIIATNPDAQNAAVVIPVGGGQIELTFDQPVDTVTGYSVTMKKASDNNAENMHVSYSASTPTIITLSYSNTLTADSIYTISIDAGFVKSLATHVTNRAVQLSYRVENPVAAPVIMSVKYGEGSDLDGANDIPFAEKFITEISFTKKVYYQNDIALFKVQEMPNAEEITVENSVDSVYAGSDSTVWYVRIGGLKQETLYNFVIIDSAFKDGTGLKLNHEGNNYTVAFTTEPNYVEDIVFYTDFSTVSEHTPMFAKLADSIVEYKSTLYTNDRITYNLTRTDTLKIDDFVVSTTNTSARKVELYGYNSNSAHGQEYGLSWGRIALSNAPLALALPEVTGPAKLMWSIAGNTGLRMTSLRDGETELHVDSVNNDGSIPNAKICHYEYLGSEAKVFNLFTKSQPSQIHDYEVIKIVKQNSMSPLYSHWFNPTRETGLDTTGYIDVRFNKRIEIANASLITLTGVAAINLDSVKAIGNALRIYYTAAGSLTDTVFEVNVAVGAVRQETTLQGLSLAAHYTFDVRSLNSYQKPVSISPVSTDIDRITVYPNPVKENLYVRCNNMKSVEVFDFAGKRVALRKGDAGEYVINMLGYKSGIYFVRIETANGVVRTCKIVK
ncbi:MAG: T9SS type A sorting domain-containing protein, partial [Bacteroidales bacterium]|nr:T9SS type A sorting domain-containing protein [Bacteroidales bacterium]